MVHLSFEGNANLNLKGESIIFPLNMTSPEKKSKKIQKIMDKSVINYFLTK